MDERKIIQFPGPKKPKEEGESPNIHVHELTPDQEKNFVFKYLWVVEVLQALKQRDPHAIKKSNVVAHLERLREAGADDDFLRGIIMDAEMPKINEHASFYEAVTDRIKGRKEEKKQQRKKRFESTVTIETLARESYDSRLQYHNFDHALAAVEVGKEICRRCKEEGIPINEDVVVKALLFHDSGYIEDHKAKGFESKEAYSAHLCEQPLKRMGYDDDFIRKVKRAIMSTKHDRQFVSNEDKAVRAADLAGLLGSYELFVESNKKLKSEAEMMSGAAISWAEWKERTKAVISFYLGQDIRLTRAYEDEDGKSIFHKRAQDNLERFLAEPEK